MSETETILHISFITCTLYFAITLILQGLLIYKVGFKNLDRMSILLMATYLAIMFFRFLIHLYAQLSNFDYYNPDEAHKPYIEWMELFLEILDMFNLLAGSNCT